MLTVWWKLGSPWKQYQSLSVRHYLDQVNWCGCYHSIVCGGGGLDWIKRRKQLITSVHPSLLPEAGAWWPASRLLPPDLAAMVPSGTVRQSRSSLQLLCQVLCPGSYETNIQYSRLWSRTSVFQMNNQSPKYYLFNNLLHSQRRAMQLSSIIKRTTILPASTSLLLTHLIPLDKLLSVSEYHSNVKI